MAVKITAQNAMPNSIDSLPLVEGMFCLVEIPGRILTNVVRLPRWAVSFDNTVYISNNGRLKTRPVTVERVEGEDAYISEGLNPGTTVVTTRLIDPLENTRLTINNPDVTQ
ncbi:MAG: hypothetical protein GY864_00810 [Desulfobacterales bacterium]|nr:hypothetical protein [Desulfobacterales bacterium]